MNPVRAYRQMSFEQKTVIMTVTGLCFSAVLAGGKFILGLFTDYSLCSAAVYTVAILLAKLECVLGVKSDRRSFETRNLLIALFLFLSSDLYVGFMCGMLFIEHKAKEYGIVYVAAIAFISFTELGFAIAGIFRTANKGHYFRTIKIINFCMALIAILTTQITILDFTATQNVVAVNSYTGIAIGCFIAVIAVYIPVSPKIGVVGNEHNVFVLCDAEKNKIIDIESGAAEITLCSSRVYGSYVYRAEISEGNVDGYIERNKTFWKRLHIILKILCCILSEILVFVWLIGRFVFFIRSAFLPRRLKKKMNDNGFEKVQE